MTTETQPSGTAVPIDADLWQRLKRLDSRCDIVFSRSKTTDGATWGTGARVWVASIKLTDESERPIVVTSHKLGAAMGGAVDAAEAKGWHRP